MLLAAAAPLAHAQPEGASALAAASAGIEPQVRALARDGRTPEIKPLDAEAADKLEVRPLPRATPMHGGSLLSFHGVTVYGALDIGVAYLSHGAPLSPSYASGLPFLLQKFSKRPIASVVGGGLGLSRVGVAGEERIARDLSVVFRVETGFMPMSGRLADGLKALVRNNGVPLDEQVTAGDSSRAGQPLQGPAYLGLASRTFGTLTAGRQNGLLLDDIAKYDPQALAPAFSPLGYSGFAAGAGATESSRQDDALKYAYVHGPARVVVMHQFGDAGRIPGYADSADVGVAWRRFSADAVWMHVTDAVSAASLNAAQAKAAPGTLAATVSDNTAWSLQAKSGFGRVEVYAGWEEIAFVNPDHPAAAGESGLGGYVFSVVNNTAYTHHRVEQVSWTGVRWSATPKLDLVGAYYRYDQNSYKGSGCSDASASACSGALQYLSLVADYRITRRFEVYAGVNRTRVSDGLASGYLNHSNSSSMAGARFRF